MRESDYVRALSSAQAEIKKVLASVPITNVLGQSTMRPDEIAWVRCLLTHAYDDLNAALMRGRRYGTTEPCE